jgi:hypothetical protein
MEVLQEITVWDKCEYKVANHIYVLNSGGKMKAFQNVSTGEWTIFPKSKHFEKTRRKFIKLDMQPPAGCIDQLPEGAVVVTGSTGREYIVNNGQCTCAGFKFRGKCKHISEAH